MTSSKRIPIVQIANLPFGNPYFSTENLRDYSGIYAVLNRYSKNNGWSYRVLGVGQSRGIKDRPDDHDREPEWEFHAKCVLHPGWDKTKRCKAM